tara:strand:- start:5745 stop:13142 length:7398 start_codon:yes stop_codon:yes gene_type:complete
MPLFNKTFSLGKMNKDMDERIVPTGEYRDAVNIQVQTSDGSDAGAAQTLMGNTLISAQMVPEGSTCVGSIAHNKEDKVYYLVAGPEPSEFDWNTSDGWKDYIIEYDIKTETFKYVFVDIYQANFKVHNDVTSSLIPTSGSQFGGGGWNPMSYARYGMNVVGYDASGSQVIGIDDNSPVTVSAVTEVGIELYSTNLDFNTVTTTSDTWLNLTSKRILYFHKDRYITGLNIIDGMLFWTDNFTEPKKINIERCIGGTGGNTGLPASGNVFNGDNADWHTRLCVTPDKDYPLSVKKRLWDGTVGEPYFVKEENITVIKKHPLSAPVLKMSPNEDDRLDPSGAIASTFSASDSTPSIGISGAPDAVGVPGNSFSYIAVNGFSYLKDVGDSIINVSVANDVYWEVGDTIIFSQDQDENLSPAGFTEHDVRATITNVPAVGLSTGPFDFLIESMDKESIDEEEKVWHLRLEKREPMFEFKFPRFAYRYKYEDGEYSTFSPFSEPAFLPGPFDYLPKKAYNLGMTNRLRSLKITNYAVQDSSRPQDVVEIDLLFKDEGSPNIYTVETIKMTDGWREDDEDLYLWPDSINGPRNASNIPLVDPDEYHRGEYKVTSELIHATVPSNQLLRQWDNVPRKALAQEITGNRLVYGNYLQNYNLSSNFIDGEIKPKILVSLQASNAALNATQTVYDEDEQEWVTTTQTVTDADSSEYGEFIADGVPLPHKTCRSLREYQVGVVYGDEYGRETPVLAGKSGTGTLNIPKVHASTINKLKVQITTDHPKWAKYFKFFVKETSNEYYNMAMDRWYNAEDGNIWLSFPSADRNKIDEESFIILKKRHDTHEPVDDPARYKVIAIENSAPDFIKINVKKLGQAFNNGNDKIGATTLGFPLPEYTEIRLKDDALSLDEVFEATLSATSFGDNAQSLGNIYEQINKGIFYIRVRTTTIKSNWYQVTKLRKVDDTYHFTLDEPMKEDVEFASVDGSFAGRVDDLRLEFANHQVENKKEFEGRFFVKIYKDLVLLQNLLTPIEKNYRPTAAARLGYWNHPLGRRAEYSSSGKYVDWESFAVNCEADLNDNQCCDDSLWNPGFGIGGDTSKTGNAGNCRFFFHPANTNGATAQCGCFNCARDGVKSWMSQSHGLMFIDRIRPRACQGSYFGSGGRDPGSGAHWGRGVHASQRSMDIGFIHRGKDYGYPEEVGKVKKLLCTKGTLFRFREDPDGIIYKIIDFKLGAQTYNSTHDEWGHWGQLGQFHTWHQYTSQGNGNNMTRFRIDFEVLDEPGVGLGNGPSGYHPTGGKSYTKPNMEAELGYWGGQQIDPNFTSINLGPPLNLNFPTGTGSSGGGDDNNMIVPMPPGYASQVGACTAGGGSPITNVHGDPPSTPRQQALRWRQHATKFHHIEIVEDKSDYDEYFSSTNPAIWETEPKEDVGMDIYYEASDAIPITINSATNELFAPFGTLVANSSTLGSGTIKIASWNENYVTLDTSVTYTSGARFKFTRPDGFVSTAIVEAPTVTPTNILKIRGWEQAAYPLALAYYNDAQHNQYYTLSWFNAYCFGNGIESDRVRDDYNQTTLANGVKASTVLAEQYKEEHRKYGLIHSGIYNSTSGVNKLNQFIAGEKITKDMNPQYGSIQKLHTRDSNIVVLHEDKIMKVLADKNALFNADGGKNVAISANFLGSDSPFATKYGISTNPESCATDLAGRLYFADRTRGAVLRLSLDGITNISDYGMKDWFGDNLGPLTQRILGSFDEKKDEYNITIKGLYPVGTSNSGNGDGSSDGDQCGCDTSTSTVSTSQDDNDIRNLENTTILRNESNLNIGNVSVGDKDFYNSEVTLTFSERAKGWISFKSFVPESGVSINNEYYTFKDGEMYKHHSNLNHNTFYEDLLGDDAFTESSITVLFNDQPGTVKSFATLNYEGSQARNKANALDSEYYNLVQRDGWYVSDIKTNLQESSYLEFVSKEKKWFMYIKGDTTTLQNLDEREFSVQGVGSYLNMVVVGEEVKKDVCLTITPSINCGEVPGCTDPDATNYDPAATVDDGTCKYDEPSGCNWKCEDWVGKWDQAGSPQVYPDGRVVFQILGQGMGLYPSECRPWFVRALDTTGDWDSGGIAYIAGFGTGGNPFFHPSPNLYISDATMDTTNPNQNLSIYGFPQLGDSNGPYDFSAFPVSNGFYHAVEQSFTIYHNTPGTYYMEIRDQKGCSEILSYVIPEITIPESFVPPCVSHLNNAPDAIYNATGPLHDSLYSGIGDIYGSWAAVVMSHPDFNFWTRNSGGGQGFNSISYVRTQDLYLDPTFDPTDDLGPKPYKWEQVVRWLAILTEGVTYPDRVVQAFSNLWFSHDPITYNVNNLPFEYTDLGGGFWQVTSVNSGVKDTPFNNLKPYSSPNIFGSTPDFSKGASIHKFIDLLTVLNSLQDDAGVNLFPTLVAGTDWWQVVKDLETTLLGASGQPFIFATLECCGNAFSSSTGQPYYNETTCGYAGQ